MIGRLKRRAEFLQVAAANRKWVAPGLILQVNRRATPETTDQKNAAVAAPSAAMRVGFTASRKVGNAVERNRARRRLKAVAAEVLPQVEGGDVDLVLIARHATIDRDYEALKKDLTAGLKKLGLTKNGGKA